MGAAGTLRGRLSSPFPRCPPSCSRSRALGVGQGPGSAGSQGLAKCCQHGAPAALTPHPGAKRRGAGFQRDACDPGEGSDTKVRRKALPSATLPAGAALPPSPAEHETAAGEAGRPCLPLKCLPPRFLSPTSSPSPPTMFPFFSTVFWSRIAHPFPRARTKTRGCCSSDLGKPWVCTCLAPESFFLPCLVPQDI